ncbi:MAG: AtpZ/AtpI family protein [Pseudomonadota bacterium]
MNESGSKKEKPLLAFIGTGTLLAATVLAGMLVGYGLDIWLGTRPFFMIILGCLGFVGGMIKVYRLLTRP